MDYTRKEADGQLALAQSTEFLRIGKTDYHPVWETVMSTL